MEITTSSIFIVNDVDTYCDDLYKTFPLHSARIIKNAENSNIFLKDEAKLVMKEAYISVSTTKYIILCASRFSVIAQNMLLKILEEPPKNIIFILITSSKNSVLPTILSRLSYKYIKVKKELETCTLDIKNINLKDVYAFLQENQRISKDELKNLIESMIYKIKNENIKLNEKKLNSFTTSMRLCDLNSRPSTILSTLLLNLMDTNETL